MKMTKCPEKHLYDADKYDSCPVCAEKNERGKTPKKAKVVRVRAVKARHSAEAEAKPSPKGTCWKSDYIKPSPWGKAGGRRNAAPTTE